MKEADDETAAILSQANLDLYVSKDLWELVTPKITAQVSSH